MGVWSKHYWNVAALPGVATEEAVEVPSLAIPRPTMTIGEVLVLEERGVEEVPPMTTRRFLFRCPIIIYCSLFFVCNQFLV